MSMEFTQNLNISHRDRNFSKSHSILKLMSPLMERHNGEFNPSYIVMNISATKKSCGVTHMHVKEHS